MANDGKHYRFGDTEFWAEHGTVAVLSIKAADKDNTADGNTNYLSPSVWLKRAFAAYNQRSGCFASENSGYDKFMYEAHEVFKEADKEPDPFQEIGRTQIETDNRNIQVSNARSALVIPGMEYKFKEQRPSDILLNGYDIELVDKTKRIITQ